MNFNSKKQNKWNKYIEKMKKSVKNSKKCMKIDYINLVIFSLSLMRIKI